MGEGAFYRGADKSLARPGKKTNSEEYQGRARYQQHRDASCHQVIFFLQGKTPKKIHAILAEILACFLPSRAKDLSAPLCTTWRVHVLNNIYITIRISKFNVHDKRHKNPCFASCAITCD